MHGGEYGSPGTCLFLSGQLPFTVASALAICAVVAAVGSFPATPAVPFVAAAGLPACVAGAGASDEAADEWTFEGRYTAMRAKITAKATSGP